MHDAMTAETYTGQIKARKQLIDSDLHKLDHMLGVLEIPRHTDTKVSKPRKVGATAVLFQQVGPALHPTL